MVALGVLEGDLPSVSEGVSEGEESDLDGVLRGGEVQPQVRLAAVEREAPAEGASGEEEAAERSTLSPTLGIGPMGSSSTP